VFSLYVFRIEARAEGRRCLAVGFSRSKVRLCGPKARFLAQCSGFGREISTTFPNIRALLVW
jgi:hypothetical protein